VESGRKLPLVVPHKSDLTVPKATRRSTCSTKANNSKKDISELFRRLGQEFGTITKTFEDMAQTME
jgi:hypothetical protein